MDESKRAAARAALAELPNDGIIGLGSGSTAKMFVEEVGALVKSGRKLVGVPTSEGTRAQAQSLGIPLLGDDVAWRISVCVDGADEVDPKLNLIKGGGGAHTREKVVNFASAKNVIIVDATKLSPKLGTKWPVPLEVLPFGHESTVAHLNKLGQTTLRLRDGKPWMTDAGNFIYDLKVGTIDDPGALDRSLRSIPGVVETGLFVGRADLVLVAEESGVRRLTR
jgi:ribose 5-phosphate isomerase A